MKKSFVKKATCLLAMAMCTVMCLTSSPVTAVAQDVDTGEISIEMNMDYSPDIVLEQYERMIANGTEETGVIKYEDGIMPRDAYPPKSYHNLAYSDYDYEGWVNGRIYTLKYFNTNSEGRIYIGGFAQATTINGRPNMWQDVVIEIYDYSTNECLASFDIDDRNVVTRQPTFSLFYYDFYIYNLSPNKLYYLGFVNKVAPSGLHIKGTISHSPVNYT